MDTNYEGYHADILKVLSDGTDFGVDKQSSKIIPCTTEQCSNCLFKQETCMVDKHNWGMGEYIEPIVLTELDIQILNVLDKRWCCIARDGSGETYLFANKPSYYKRIDDLFVCRPFDFLQNGNKALKLNDLRKIAETQYENK